MTVTTQGCDLRHFGNQDPSSINNICLPVGFFVSQYTTGYTRRTQMTNFVNFPPNGCTERRLILNGPGFLQYPSFESHLARLVEFT